MLKEGLKAQWSDWTLPLPRHNVGPPFFPFASVFAKCSMCFRYNNISNSLHSCPGPTLSVHSIICFYLLLTKFFQAISIALINIKQIIGLNTTTNRTEQI